VTCLWQSESLTAVQEYVDSTLGDASVNRCFEVDSERAFADVPSLQPSPALAG
jgi:hypothetical protein